MLGAIAGDVIGSVYESQPIKTTQFQLFSPGSTYTDDSVLTMAIADAILNDIDYSVALKQWGCQYPNAGYGGKFYRWLFTPDSGPYNSWGNGAAMRVSPIGFAFESLDEVLHQARNSAAVTHNHPEGIKGAQAVATAIYLARTGKSKAEIKQEIRTRFAYNVDQRLDEIRPQYRFDVSCQGSVPQSIIAFLESYDYEDAVRKAISLGGDSDTMACIAGGIAQAFYKTIPEPIVEEVMSRLPMVFVKLINAFNQRYDSSRNNL
jgi:ADP-ribosylglycohydrolase